MNLESPLSPLEEMKLKYPNLPVLSATQIKLFKNCRLLYRFNYRDKEQQLQHIASDLGSAIHKAIEHRLKTGQSAVQHFSETFDQLIDDHAEAGILKHIEKKGELKVLGLDIVRNIDWTLLNPRDEDSIEMRFTLPFPNKKRPIALITGIMDLITADSIIIDHKSSSKLPSASDLANDPQFILYHWAYKELYKKPPFAVIWHHLRNGKHVNTYVEKDFKSKLDNVTVIINDMLQETEYPKKEKKDGFCMFVCDYNNHCWPRQ